MKFLWCTDIHLDHCEYQTRLAFLEQLKYAEADAIIISGDIADGESASKYLHEMSMDNDKLIYWICGNHDCFGLSLGEANEMFQAMHGNGNLRYLGGESHFVSLGHETALVGINGWADGRAGDFFKNRWGAGFADFEWINDFRAFQQCEDDETLRLCYELMGELGEKSAKRAQAVIGKAFEKNDHVIVVTHAPPFPQCCLFQNKPQTQDVLPLYCNLTLGNTLGELMIEYKDKKMTVLCGHTHTGYTEKIMPNLTCYVGHSRYEHPAIQQTFIIE